MSGAATPKGAKRRQALVASAAELLLEGGFDAVRHRAVATRAGLPLASTTYYFDSLDDLIACAVELNGNADMDAVRARVAAVTQRRRGPESTVDLLVEVLLGEDEKRPESRERLIARYERFVACARHPALREVQLRLRAQLDEALTEALARSGRTSSEGQLRRLVAMVDGAMISALGEYDPDPRGLARGMLLESIDVMAPPA
ncbi:TetR family transcriptional regulator [Rhodococcus sp. ACPA4]|uniref:TetR family transcriptional regulator n=1 Tax=Nocardia globerula TaxID=1818 RepID=A0A652YUR7_NOCGL|nr:MULTISPECIES: TetR family transcriptional regulator [Rhodococcus]NMD60842.1 TetR family transcriptional regulator [Nocardia globerula]NRI65299.1 TetR family transcriptional regulator [Rhodococcus sp. MS16]KJF20964.1 putative DNA-binding transcriptional regulator [Rhodococcus sp. AD45]PBC37441.1 TetR family transcriptional regulator [Rhodococcus sp. ACPA4]PSR38520.1 TetR family transcriptional regulator [Rhodococcus sp. AD45-ID]